eukprot:COSAG01_NODE_26278_length_719_cov_0.598387_1_plen_114_part_00
MYVATVTTTAPPPAAAHRCRCLLCVQMARTRNPSRRFGKKIKKTTRAPPRSRVATVPTTTAVKMVKKWEREHGACARMIKVDRDDDQKKVCYDEKRHYNQLCLWQQRDGWLAA